MKKYTLTLRVLSVLLLISLMPGCQHDEKITTESSTDLPPVKIDTMVIKPELIADQIEIMGSVQAEKKTIISSRISGNIIEIDVIPGSRVTEGQTLVEINAGEISAKLLQAKAQFDQANRNLEREKKLLQQKAATPEAVKSLEDLQKIAKASYKEAQIMLSYTTIPAPFDGRITKKLVDVGELASPGTQLLHMEDENNLQIVADVPETIAQNITLGMIMQIHLPTAQLDVDGIVAEIAPAADSLTRTVPIKLNINKNFALRSGQFARVKIPGEKTETLLAPQDSIIPLGQLERVFIVEDGRARMRLVRTGKIFPQGYEILAGLKAGDQLIVKGADLVKDGQHVQLQ